MRKVNIPKFRKEVIAIVTANQSKINSFEIKDNDSVIVFYGKEYKCEIRLNDKWIGYWLEIDAPKDCMRCFSSLDTDIYPIYGEGYEEVALEIYDGLINTIKAIFSGEVYYVNLPEYQYICIKNKNGTYRVTYEERKKFIFWHYSKGWSDESFPVEEFEKLNLKKLS